MTEPAPSTAAARLTPGDRAVVGPAALLFLLFASYGILRPLREDVSVHVGRELIPWLWTGTAVATFLLAPLLGAAITRLPRRRLLPALLAACALVLAGFGAAYHCGLQHGTVVPAGFYVWVSTYHLFVLALFWGTLADLFDPQRAARTFGWMAFGGTTGVLGGAGLTALLAARLGATNLVLVAALLLAGAAGGLRWLLPRRPARPPAAAEPPCRPSAWSGFRACIRSPYLAAIVGYVVLQTFASSVLYLEQTDIVRARFGDDRGARTEFFAELDFWVQAATLGVQLTLTGLVLSRLGVGIALAVQPLVCLAGFALLARADASALLITFAVFEGSRRVANYALAKPARDTLFTTASEDDRYLAKSVIDAVVYRGSDVAIAATTDLWRKPLATVLGSSAAALAAVSMPLAAVWSVLSLGLGTAFRRRQT